VFVPSAYDLNLMLSNSYAVQPNIIPVVKLMVALVRYIKHWKLVVYVMC
jgi:hypothetical protein